MTPLRLTKADSIPEPPTRPSRPGRQDAIGVWLSALVAVMRMPEREKAEIREELESHLRERVRDLLIEGVEEDEASRRALAELGEAAPLADRFRHARNTPRRRLIMNIAAVGLAGAALVTSVVALRAEPGKQEAVALRREHAITFEPALDNPANGLVRLKVVLDMGNDLTITDAVEAMAKTANLKPRIHWQSLTGEAGIDREFRVHMDKVDTDLAGGLRALFDAIGKEQPGGYNLEYRVNGDVLEVATRNYFDSREARLVRFDVQDILENGVDKDEFRELIQTFVEPESWRDNGGDKASIRIVGGRLFVKAPPRMIEGVEFFVAQLSDRGEKKVSKAREEALTTTLAQLLVSRTGEAAVADVPIVHPPRGDRAPLLVELIRKAQTDAVENAKPADPPDSALPVGKEDPRSQSPSISDTRTFTLRHADAEAARDLLHSAFNATPALKECAVERKFGVASRTNAVIFQATTGQADLAAKIIALIDAPAPAQLPSAEEAVERYILSNVAAETMRDLLTEAFNVSPALKECAVGRSVIVDSQLNAVVVVATADQQETVNKLIKLVDIGDRVASR